MYVHVFIGLYIHRSRDRSVNITTGYRLEGRGLIPGKVKRIFFIPQRPDWLWVPPGLLFNGYPGVKYVGVKMTIHSHHFEGTRLDLIEVPSQHLPGGTEDNYENPQSV
jgi:hypothetical protein